MLAHLKTTLKVSLYSYLNQANSGQIMTINTGNLFVFEVGPSAPFPYSDQISLDLGFEVFGPKFSRSSP